MLDPRYVVLDDDSPADLLREAIALAKQLRFVTADAAPTVDWQTLVANATADWSGFLGDEDGPVCTEFKRFFADPAAYEPALGQPLARPHIALFVAFIYILQHARGEINAFSQRHLDHYFRQVLQLDPLPAQPAEAFVTMALKAGEGPTFLPAGTRLLAPDAGEDVVLETTSGLELHAGQIAQRSALRVQFEPAGFRKLLQAQPGIAGMQQIKDLIWQRGVGQRLQPKGWNSFTHLLEGMEVKEMRRDFPSDILQLNLDDFREMMQMAPKAFPMGQGDEELLGKWEALHARMLLADAYPMAEDANVTTASGFQEKLSAALFNGRPLPNYRGLPMQLYRLDQDSRNPETTADAVAALNYLRNVLYLEETDFQALFEVDGTKEGLPKLPAALVEAGIRKASSLSPMLLRQQAHRIAATEDATRLHRHAAGAQAGWFPYGIMGDAFLAGTDATDYGMLIESPILDMAEGDRTIVLQLKLALTNFEEIATLFDTTPPGPEDWISPFEFQVSGEKAWLEASWRKTKPRIDAENSLLIFFLDVPANLPSLTSPGEKFPDTSLIGKGPLLNMRLAPLRTAEVGSTVDPNRHLLCKVLQAVKIDLEVRVSGLRAFQAQNQQSQLKVSAPFEPFGKLPGPHTELMVAHPELCLKQLDSVEIDWDWMEMPADLERHYAPYFGPMGDSPAITGIAYAQADFKASVHFVTGRWSKQLTQAHVAFLTPHLSVPVNDVQPLEEQYDAAQIAAWDAPEEWPRYLKLEYRSDWYPQKEYEKAERRLAKALVRATDEVAAAAQAVTNNTAVAPGEPTNEARLATAKAVLQTLVDMELQQPYVPKLKGMRLGYTAKVEIPLVEWVAKPTHRERLYHQMPFGNRELPTGIGSPQPLLPTFQSQGAVLIGLRDLTAGASLSLLLKVQPGSGDPDVPAPEISWWYYGTSGWREMPAQGLLADETNGLTQTGLLKLVFPADAMVAETELPGKLHWIMAGTSGDCDTLPDWNDLHIHAVRARQLVTAGKTLDVWQLPSGSVNTLELTHPAVGVVQQPYDAVKGKPSEADEEFYKRISERLRHKNRAVTAWDYEHLCLQQFPELYAAKALQAKALSGRRPGEMNLVVIPDLRTRQFADPFQPKLGYGELREISDFVTRLAPPTAVVVARNARFRPLLVGTSVRFAEGVSASTGKYLLQQRLKQFLAPWAFDNATSMNFGGRIYLSEVVDIIQGEPYVNFVGKTRLFVGDEQGKFAEATIPSGDSSAYIEIEDADVFTSVSSHYINEIGNEDVKDEIWGGISWMVIGSDFVIADDPETQEDVFDEWVGISWNVIGKDFQVGNSPS
jgi:hypothetical protein